MLDYAYTGGGNFLKQQVRLDYIISVYRWVRESDDLERWYTEINAWYCGGYGYLWDTNLFALTGCLDSELL